MQRDDAEGATPYHRLHQVTLRERVPSSTSSVDIYDM